MTHANEKIRITSEEAYGSHVDDLLNRQKSLRGEGGIGRNIRKPWYFRNWLLFGIIAGLAAFLGWAVIEPHFNDRLYIQGALENLEIDAEAMRKAASDPMDRALAGEPLALGTLRVAGTDFLWLEETRFMRDGVIVVPNTSELIVGRQVGLHFMAFSIDGGRFMGQLDGVILDPEPLEVEETKTLDQMVKKDTIVQFLCFPLIAGFIGFALGLGEGLVVRQPRRALLSAWIGLMVGLVGGFIAVIPSGILYSVTSNYANGEGFQSLGGFAIQVMGRGVAWAISGAAMGLGQGLALRSKQLVLYGLIGGFVGGLLGGLFFDPIDFLLDSPTNFSADLSRMVGFTIIGLTVGGMIGVVELLARDSWLRMTRGPLAGKEFLFFKETMKLGASPRCEIYLFNDPEVLEHHATLRILGEDCEIESTDREKAVLINGRPVQKSKLRHGDLITLGATSFIYEKKRG